VGLTNYAACYATGLLIARRLLKKLGLDTQYEGKVKADGELYSVEASGEKKPFHALLDVGLARTSTGARIFGALKGALDGGLDIPHSETRFRGFFDKKYDVSAGRDSIFSAHVGEYMSFLQDEDEGKYHSHFAQYIKHGITAENLQEKIAATHAAIRKSPQHVSNKSTKEKERKRHARKKATVSQRKDRVRQKMASKAKKGATESA
jgi:large subunit ribosomal protein L5e